jgi:hypothetical protein
MVSETTLIVSIIGAVFASTGFWAFLTFIIQRKDTKDSAESQMLKGLGHDRICFLGSHYIEQGYITRDDYENLHDYLYLPYKKLGGNGTAEKIMKEVESLPLKEKEEKKK